MKNLFGENHGLDTQSIDYISKALEKANLPGFDYIEFKSALFNLSKMGLEEPIAYKSAFATASTLGLTKEKLIETAEHYKAVVEKEKQHFDSALQNRQQMQIGENLEKAKKLEQIVTDNELKIKALQSEIESSRGQLKTLDFDREQAQVKIDEAKSRFILAHQSILNQMEKDISNLKTHI
jgi:predicted RNase H-like nuclease (RuvC/YqgF family)